MYPMSNPLAHVTRDVPANIRFSSIHIPYTSLYSLSHIITYDIQNICREPHDDSYCRKCIHHTPYMSDCSDDEFKSAETRSFSSFLFTVTSLYSDGNKK